MQSADHVLLSRWIVNRDAQAFKSLTVKYCSMVYGTSVRILRNASDAEEVTQECFAALASASKSPHGSMGAWLHRIATYQALNRRRADHRRLQRELQFVRLRGQSAEATWDDLSQFIDQSIEALPEKNRIAVVAHFIENESVTGIAAREGVSHSAISQRIQRGVELIRERMRQNGIPIGAAALTALLAQQASAWPSAPATVSASLGKLAITGIAKLPQRGLPPLAMKLASGAAALAVAAAIIGYALVAPSQSVNATQQGPASTAASHTTADAPKPAPPANTPDSVAFASAPPTQPAPPPTVSAPKEIVPAASEAATWSDVVNAYVAHQNRIRRIRFDFDHASSGNYYWYNYTPQPSGYREFSSRGSLVTDGDRCGLQMYRWGHLFGGDIVPPNRAELGLYAYDGDTYASCDGMIQFSPNAKQSEIRDSAFRNGRTYLLFGRYPGGPMLGFPFDHEGSRMEDFLRDAQQIVMRPDKDNGCYVIDADTDYGVFSVWFNPTRDYNIARSVIALGPGDIYETSPLMEDTSAYYEYAVEQFVQVDGLWVPAQASMRQIARLRGGNGHDYTHRHTRSNIQLVKKGEDDDAYVIYAEDIPNGTELLTFGARSSDAPRWFWQNDRFVARYKDPRANPEHREANARGFGAGMIATRSAK